MNISEEIMSWLEDEESRFIYKKRTEFYETGNFGCIDEIVGRYVPPFKRRYYQEFEDGGIAELLKDKRHIIIFGSGNCGRYVLNLLKSRGMTGQIAGIADNNSSTWGEELEGIKIHSPEDIDFENTDAVFVTPYDPVSVGQIHEPLGILGLKEHTFLLDYRECFPGDFTEMQYFAPDIIELGEHEVFVDAGVLDLDTSIRFAGECQKRNIKNFRIHAFEPDDISYQRCLDRQKELPVFPLQLHHAGLWATDTTLYFKELGNGCSCITEQKTPNAIKAVSLDQCVSDKVTFIKMDIEGAELEALKGSKEIIKQYKPKLAISIYHKKEDLTEIPRYIKSLVPEYKMYIRHYSNYTAETVLYAVL